MRLRKRKQCPKLKKMFISCLLLFAILLTSIASNTIPAEAVEANAVNDARYAVVRIMGVGNDGSVWVGSGFGIGTGDGYADTFLTNWHVVTDIGEYNSEDVTLYILLDDETKVHYYSNGFSEITLGSVVECEVVYEGQEYPDFAILKTEEPIQGVEKLKLRRVTQSMVGQTIYTIGYPTSADTTSREETSDGYTQALKGTVSAVSVATGTVSRCLEMELVGYTYCVEHDAHINNGNSGGPLVLEDGSVIGINTYGYGDDDENMEYSVSIYIDYAIDALDDLGIAYTLADDNAEETTAAQSSGDGTASQDETSTADPQSDGLSATAIAGIVAAVIVVAALAAVLVLRGKKKPNSAGASGNISGQGAVEAGATAPANMGAGAAAAGAEEYRIQGIEGTYAGRRFRPEGEIYLGRDRSRCQIVFPEGTAGVSGCHCVIKLSDGKLLVADTGSTYGTYVNGEKLTPNQYRQLSVGDEICVGSEREKFRITRRGGAV